jgi:excisionase family DNA binding protein
VEESPMREKPAIQPNAIYSREEAAALLGVSLTTLKRLIVQGHLMASRPNGVRRVFIRGSYILKMLDQNVMEGQA